MGRNSGDSRRKDGERCVEGIVELMVIEMKRGRGSGRRDGDASEDNRMVEGWRQCG